MDVPAGSLISFDEACELVVGYLKKWVPLAFWSVSRFDGERQIYYYVQDDAYGKSAGDSHAWSDSFCQYMVAGVAPQIAPDAMAVPLYEAVGIAQQIDIGAYAGAPVRHADGSLFGTLCGLDPQVQDADLMEHAPLLHIMATLLEQILQAERLRAEAAVRETELCWTTLHDRLTGLPDRAMFLDLVAIAVGRGTDSATPRPAVLLLDLDDFAAVNDTFGHAAGDDLLVEFAGRLSSALKALGAVARMSGDEFAVLLHDGKDLRAAGALVERVLADPFTLAGVRVQVSAAVGAALVPDGAAFEVDAAQVVDTVLARADIAKHAATTGSRGGFAVYDPTMTLPAARDLSLREPLREAIRSGAVQAVYQPIVELDSGRVIGYEALARWSHDGVPVPPDVFVPVADRGGLLPAPTDHMLELAAAQLARWSQTLGHRRLQVGVNVPPGLFVDPEFPDRVERCVRRHGLASHQLVLEITEDALLTDPDAARAGARRLREIGAMLSLDDFGAGYSSLLHLHQIPLHSVKIDRGFADDLEANGDSRRFMRAVLALGRDLGLRVVVEGVERHSQAEVLHRLLGTHAQGYYFGRPAHPDDIRVQPDAEKTECAVPTRSDDVGRSERARRSGRASRAYTPAGDAIRRPSMTDIAAHEPTFSVELDSGVVVLRWASGVVITGPRAAEAMTAVDRLNGGRRRPLLVDMTGTDKLTREGRETFRGDVLVSRMALVGKSAVDRVIANFGLRVSSLEFPARFFTSVAAGMAWLRQHE